jgi:hypothetical protein
MSKIPTVRIYNADDTFTDRPMNETELKQYEKDRAEAEARIVEEAKKATDKVALLEKLGISEDEAKLLLG